MSTASSTVDEYYLEARDEALEAARSLNGKHKKFRTPDGVVFRIQRKPPLRLYLLMVDRWTPGEDGWTGFSFQRNGRVNLGGNRKVPLRQAAAAKHEPWASRQEVLELAEQLRTAVPDQTGEK